MNHNTVKKWGIVIWALLGSVWGMSQTHLSGKVWLEDGEVAYGAFVSLVSAADSMTPLQFTIVDTEGNWHLETSEQGAVFLRAAYLGYKAYFEPVMLEADSQRYEITLRADVAVVQEVEVTAKAIDIVQRGDTLRYNVGAFLTGGEQTLGDVLRKMPGFEVSDNGQITYNGKKIDKLLIEGRDILNDQHQLATEGVSSHDLLAIELIDQYKGRKEQFDGTTSDKLALNIDLDNKGKTIWSGNATLGGGYENKAKASASLIGVGQRSGLTVFGKGNNTGEAVITSADMLNTMSMRQLLRSYQQSGGDMEGLAPPALQLPTTLQQNADALLSANGEWSPTDDLDLRLNVLSARIGHTSGHEFLRTYTDGSLLFLGDYTLRTRLPMLNVRPSLEYEWRKKWYIELDLPTTLQREDHNESWQGLFNAQPTDIEQQREAYQINTLPLLNVSYKITPQTQLIAQLVHHYQRQDRFIELTSIDSILGYPLDRIQQQNRTRRNTTTAELALKRSSGNIKWKIASQYGIDRQTLNLTATPVVDTLFAGRNHLRHGWYGVGTSLAYEDKHWLLRGEMDITHHLLTLDSSPAARTLFNPTLTAKYSFSKLHFIMATYRNTNTILPLQHLSPLQFIQDAQTLQSSVIAPRDMPLNHTYTLNYTHVNLSNRSMLNLTLSTSQQRQIRSSRIDNLDDFIRITSILQPIQHNTTGRLLFSKPYLDNSLKLTTNTSYQRLTSTILQENAASPMTLQLSATDLQLQTQRRQALNGSLGLAFQHQSQSMSRTGVAQQFATLRPSTSLTYHRGPHTLSVEAQSIHFINRPSLAPILMLNAKWMYSPDSKPFTFSLVGNNLLNLHPPQQTQFTFNPIFIERQTYRIFPGFVLLQVNYLFSQSK